MRISLRLLSAAYLKHAKKSSKKKTVGEEVVENSPLKVKIGLEIHARIQSNTKIFSDSSCVDTITNIPVNSQVSVFDAAFPGTMPTLNRRCVEASLLTALALKCNINAVSCFERKHYFYADLPAGFQITQQRQPIAFQGVFAYPIINPKTSRLTYKHARIRRIQLEHDSARSLQTGDLKVKSSSSSSELSTESTLIDLNRVGVGLMEIVTEPDFDEAFDAYSFARELAITLRSLGTCAAQMSDGGFRVDVNVSVHERGPENGTYLPGTRVELKNLNSFNAVLKATEYEIERQKSLVRGGARVELETRTFDAATRRTVAIRTKEDQYDYRFMAEPNLLPLVVYPMRSFKLLADDDEQNRQLKCENNQELVLSQQFLDYLQKGLSPKFFVDLDKVKDDFKTKKLPQTRRDYIIENFKLTHENAFLYVANNLDLIMIEINNLAKTPLDIQLINKILTNDYLALVNLNVDLDSIELRRRCEKIISYADVLANKLISRRVKSALFGKLFEPANRDKMARDLVDEMNVRLIADASVIGASVEKLIGENSAAVAEYKSKEKKRLKIVDFFVNRVHKDLNDRADPDLVDKLVLERLKKLIE